MLWKEKTLIPCVKASYLWREVTKQHSLVLCKSLEWKCKAEKCQSNCAETSRSWAVIVAGVASSSDAGVIAPFHDSEYFGLSRMHLAASNRVVLR